MRMPASIRGLLVAFVAELCDTACVNTQELLYCERAAAAELLNATQALAQDPPFSERNHARVSLLALVKRAHEEMAKGGKDARGWRRIYTDTSVVLAFDAVSEFWSSQDEAFAFSAISHLDHAIVIAGAPGEGRLDLVFDLIEGVQSECLGVPPGLHRKRSFEATSISAPNTVLLPVLSAQNEFSNPETPPSISSFISRLSRQPFVLPRYLSDWPALNEHPWSSVDYLRSIAGPGRVVPVEVGSDYRNDDWTQTMMPWDEFLGSLVESPLGAAANPVLYLAQHNLFAQFPSLKDDILVPDYVYCELDPPPNYPLYVPPANEHRLVLNAWLGPKGTVSPAHTDPFFNFYAQVVGRKTIWLAPPEVSSHMYPYPSHNSSTCTSDQPRNPAGNNQSPSLSNTSRVDVFPTSPEGVAASKPEFPDFWEHAVSHATTVTLNPGDLLFFPPGWWHAMRSEETSFSVSMWF